MARDINSKPVVSAGNTQKRNDEMQARRPFAFAGLMLAGLSLARSVVRTIHGHGSDRHTKFAV